MYLRRSGLEALVAVPLTAAVVLVWLACIAVRGFLELSAHVIDRQATRERPVPGRRPKQPVGPDRVVPAGASTGPPSPATH